MLEAIEKLLILQDRDRKILKVKEELSHIPVERQQLTSKLDGITSRLESAKNQLLHIESDRKKLELDVDAKKQQADKYSLQQFQTKKNEEYRALSNEIENCKRAVVQLEDEQLGLMEQAEQMQKQIAVLSGEMAEAKRVIDSRLGDLGSREKVLQKELAELETNRAALASAVEESALNRYERLLRSKGQNVVVGIQHGVCGGCHMQLNRQVVVHCQGDQEIMTCPNCGRILYYTPDMDVAVLD